MFTGIITETAKVSSHTKDQDGLKLKIEMPTSWHDLKLGESVATDGVCLTVSEIGEGNYACHLMKETLDKTTFGKKVPAHVNLERSLSAGDRLGGHIVQGHVDCIGKVVKIGKEKGTTLEIEFDSHYTNLVVRKGAVTLNGVSLTVTMTTKNTFSVALVPYTLEHTNLGTLSKNDQVNIEFDIVGKYIEKIARPHAES